MFGCGTSRRTKRIGNMEVTERKRRGPQKMVGRLARGNYEDKKSYRYFKRQIENDKMFACEKNFHSEDIETRK